MANPYYQVPIEGIGSFFHSIPNIKDNLSVSNFDEDCLLFYNGRHAIKYLIDYISLNREVKRIWIPDYYCQHVAAWIKTQYSNVFIYEIHPFDFDANLSLEEFANSDDIVIINNLLGLNNSFSTIKEEVIIIEDHSHGWLNEACLNSKADYCFASLRKSLPIPLGGICWAPNSKIDKVEGLLESDNSVYIELWDRINEAMELKSEYALSHGQHNSLKKKYLSAIQEAEEVMHHEMALVKLNEEHENIIRNHFIYDILKPKADNLAFLLDKLEKREAFKILSHDNNVSFGLNLAFSDKEKFDDFRKHLIKNYIYPSHLWPDNSDRHNGLWIINIHVDLRYNLDDMEYVVGVINEWH